jgi:hypothetical protein
MPEAGPGLASGHLTPWRCVIIRMHLLARWRLILCAALTLLDLGRASLVRAQEIQRFQPALDDNGFLGLDGTRTPGALRGSAHLFTDLAFNPVDIRVGNTQSARVDERVMLHFGAELGLWGRGAIALRLPMVLQQQEVLLGTRHTDVFVPTDPQALLRYRILGASMAERDVPHDGPGLALQLGAAFPLGKSARLVENGMPLSTAMMRQPFATDGTVRTDVALLGDFQLFGAGIGGSVGWRHHFADEPTNNRMLEVVSIRDELTFAAAIKVPIPLIPTLAGVLEVRGVSDFESRDTSLELDLGARLKLGNFVIVLGGGFGLTNDQATPDGRILLGAYFVLPEGDQDHDGVDDADDACVYLPEDRDGFQDSDGCPDPDNDNDLIPDVDDKCPNVAAEEGRDEDEDGCTDPVKK